MDIFGLTLQELIFNLFLPFLFLYILLYALLRKSKILGKSEETNILNTMLALVLSALGIFSLYSLGLTVWLPYLAAFTAVASFIVMYFFGVAGQALKRTTSYISGDAFKTEDEKKFEAGMKDCEAIVKRLQTEKVPEIRQKLSETLDAKLAELKPIAQKLGKSLYDYEWGKEKTK